MAGKDGVVGASIRASELFGNPDYLLHGINFARGTCEFLEVGRATYERSSFLDQRVMVSGSRSFTADLGELVHLSRSIRPPQLPQGFIAHTSFCCSTLLARTLEFPGRSLVLREPQVLLMLARAYREHPDFFPAPARHVYLKLVLRLLNKSYGRYERVLIKPSNLANRLLEDWLDGQPETRGVLLTCGLEDYLVSVLRKTGETRQKMPWVARALALDSDYLQRCPELDRELGGHLEAAAVAWHAQRYQLGTLVARYPGRILPLDQSTLLDRPLESLSRVCRHLRLDTARQELEERVEGELWTRHAKDQRHPYDAARRRDDYERARRRHASRIRRVVDWLTPFMKRVPDPFAEGLAPRDRTNFRNAHRRAMQGQRA